jgi:hypothetical protein
MVTSLVCATASSAGKAMSWSGSPSVYGALVAAVAAASSSRSVVAFKGIAVPAVKSLSVCSRRDDDDDDDDDGVDMVQRGRRKRRGCLCKQPRRTLLNSTFLRPLVLIRTMSV